MQIDRVIYPVTALGPGERLVIWTVGCSKHCYKCANPELWESNKAKDTNVHDLISSIRNSLGELKIDGVTVTGGDPLEQYDELALLLPLLHNITDDILIFTGYTIEQARSAIPKKIWAVIKEHTSVIIDGAYIDEYNDNKSGLRGSTNQKLHFWDTSKKPLYLEYIAKGRTIQNVHYNDSMISIGIHNKGM